MFGVYTSILFLLFTIFFYSYIIIYPRHFLFLIKQLYSLIVPLYCAFLVFSLEAKITVPSPPSLIPQKALIATKVWKPIVKLRIDT